jgi:hypothetical protein
MFHHGGHCGPHRGTHWPRRRRDAPSPWQVTPTTAFIPELFATRYRYSGTALAVNIAGVAGGAVPPADRRHTASDLRQTKVITVAAQRCDQPADRSPSLPAIIMLRRISHTLCMYIEHNT